MEPICIRCGPKGLPAVMVELEAPDGTMMLQCLRCHLERERIGATRRDLRRTGKGEVAR